MIQVQFFFPPTIIQQGRLELNISMFDIKKQNYTQKPYTKFMGSFSKNECLSALIIASSGNTKTGKRKSKTSKSCSPLQNIKEDVCRVVNQHGQSVVLYTTRHEKHLISIKLIFEQIKKCIKEGRRLIQYTLDRAMSIVVIGLSRLNNIQQEIQFLLKNPSFKADCFARFKLDNYNGLMLFGGLGLENQSKIQLGKLECGKKSKDHGKLITLAKGGLFLQKLFNDNHLKDLDEQKDQIQLGQQVPVTYSFYESQYYIDASDYIGCRSILKVKVCNLIEQYEEEVKTYQKHAPGMNLSIVCHSKQCSHNVYFCKNDQQRKFLYARQLTNDGFKCDYCSFIIGSQNSSLTCGACQIDICHSCSLNFLNKYSKQAHLKFHWSQQLECYYSHKLQLFDNLKDRIQYSEEKTKSCQFCSQKIPLKGAVIACTACNLDICGKCFLEKYGQRISPPKIKIGLNIVKIYKQKNDKKPEIIEQRDEGDILSW